MRFSQTLGDATMTTATHNDNEVLFQKLGNTWYVFSEVNDQFVYSALPNGMDPRTTRLELYEVIEDHMSKVAAHHSSKRTPQAAA